MRFPPAKTIDQFLVFKGESIYDGLGACLRTDFNRRSIWDNTPNFLNFFVGYCDTAGCPINQPMKAPKKARSVAETMDHDHATRRNAFFLGAQNLFWRRVGDVQRQMKLTLWVSVVDGV